MLLFLVAVLAVAFGVTWVTFGDTHSKRMRRDDGGGLEYFSQHRKPRAARGGDQATPPSGAEAGAASDVSTWSEQVTLLEKTESQREQLSLLASTCCRIPVHSKSVSLLSSPREFFNQLCERVRRAERRVVMSALYIGDGPLSTSFVQCMEEKVKQKSAAGEPFELVLLLDYNRMHDKRNLVTLKNLLNLAHLTEGTEALDTMGHAVPLVCVRLYLFQTPCRWNALFEPFGRAKELLGVQHTKIFCFDDTDLLLTGANLSDDYFATRIDRYIVFDQSPLATQWFSELASVLTRMSHRVVCRQAFDTSRGESVVYRQSVSPIQRVVIPFKASPVGSSPTLHRKSDLVILPNELGIDPSTESEAFISAAKRLLKDFSKCAMEMCEQAPPAAKDDEVCDTFIFPTLQFARVGIEHDSHVFQQLLRLSSASSHVFLTSPYLNMYSDFVDEVIRGESSYDFITASVKTNGWLGQKGLAGYIPFFYLQVERAFYFLMKAYGCDHRVTVREFSEPGFTFHSKGAWIFSREKDMDTITPPQKSAAARGSSPSGLAASCEPFLVAYGSSNYGYRSVQKDVEANIFLYTKSKELKGHLFAELQRLLALSSTVDDSRFLKGAEGRFQPVVSLMAFIGQDFM